MKIPEDPNLPSTDKAVLHADGKKGGRKKAEQAKPEQLAAGAAARESECGGDRRTKGRSSAQLSSSKAASPEVAGTEATFGSEHSNEPPLPPPNKGPPSLGKTAQVQCSQPNTSASEPEGGLASANEVASKSGCGRRGSYVVKSDVAKACKRAKPPESTPEPSSPTLQEAPCIETIVEGVRSRGGVLGKEQKELAFFGVSVPNKARGSARIEQKFQDKSCESSVGSAALPAARERLAKEAGIAVLCSKALKPELPNQDNYFFCQAAQFLLCGVADGHGLEGHWVSHWAARFVLRMLLSDPCVVEGKLPENEAIARIFDQTHEALKLAAQAEGFDLVLSGATLTVVLIHRSSRSALLAWVGDSRGVVGRMGAKGAEIAVATRDHKPQDPGEKRRIVSSGGEVVSYGADLPHRVFVQGQEAPGLAMSRAVGDLLAHSVGVIHSPSFKRFTFEADHCLLCCSDGVWEFIKNSEALKMVAPLGPSRSGEAVKLLVNEAQDRWLHEEQNLTDDITAILVWGWP